MQKPIEIFQQVNYICALSVSVARAWLIQNKEARDSLLGMCAKAIMKCMDCTLGMGLLKRDETDAFAALDLKAKQTISLKMLDAHLTKELSPLREACGLTPDAAALSFASPERDEGNGVSIDDVDAKALVIAVGETALADAWVDKHLLGSEPNLTGSSAYDNILEVRAMLENRVGGRCFRRGYSQSRF